MRVTGGHRAADTVAMHSSPRVVLGGLVLAAALVVAIPAAALAADPYVRKTYRTEGYVPQYTIYQCIAASTQMMANFIVIGDGYPELVDRSSTLQRWLHIYARDRDTQPNATTKGSDPQGWAAALEGLSVPYRYRDLSFPTYREAMRYLAYRLAVTGQPVGVLVSAGRHASVVTGVVTSADPRTTPTYEVIGVYLSGPLTTLGSRSDPRNAYIAYAAFTDRFRRYDDPARPRWHGQWVIVSPEGYWTD